jgi:hypothetical protein
MDTRELSPRSLSPHHERIHRSFYVAFRLLLEAILKTLQVGLLVGYFIVCRGEQQVLEVELVEDLSYRLVYAYVTRQSLLQNTKTVYISVY